MRRLVEQDTKKKSTHFSYAALIRAKSPTQLIILSLKLFAGCCVSPTYISHSFLDNETTELCACDDEPIEILIGSAK